MRQRIKSNRYITDFKTQLRQWHLHASLWRLVLQQQHVHVSLLHLHSFCFLKVQSQQQSVFEQEQELITVQTL